MKCLLRVNLVARVLRERVVEQVVKKLLSQLLPDIVGDQERVVVQNGPPELLVLGIALYSVICGSKQSASIETVEGGYQTSKLQEFEQRQVVWISAEDVDQSG
jgi:hypothetical protein